MNLFPSRISAMRVELKIPPGGKALCLSLAESELSSRRSLVISCTNEGIEHNLFNTHSCLREANGIEITPI
jgi:hypothetical protein